MHKLRMTGTLCSTRTLSASLRPCLKSVLDDIDDDGDGLGLDGLIGVGAGGEIVVDLVSFLEGLLSFLFFGMM